MIKFFEKYFSYSNTHNKRIYGTVILSILLQLGSLLSALWLSFYIEPLPILFFTIFHLADFVLNGAGIFHNIKKDKIGWIATGGIISLVCKIFFIIMLAAVILILLLTHSYSLPVAGIVIFISTIIGEFLAIALLYMIFLKAENYIYAKLTLDGHIVAEEDVSLPPPILELELANKMVYFDPKSHSFHCEKDNVNQFSQVDHNPKEVKIASVHSTLAVTTIGLMSSKGKGKNQQEEYQPGMPKRNNNPSDLSESKNYTEPPDNHLKPSSKPNGNNNNKPKRYIQTCTV